MADTIRIDNMGLVKAKIEQVKNENDPGRKMDYLADALLLMDTFAQIRGNQTGEMHKTIHGNGDMKKGMQYQLQLNTNFRLWVLRGVGIVSTGVGLWLLNGVLEIV